MRVKINVIKHWWDSNKVWSQYVLLTILLTFVAFVGYDIYQSWNNVNWSGIQIEYINILPFSMFFTFSIIAFAKGWQMDLSSLQVQLPFRESTIIFMKSQLGKYIPGKIGIVITKVIEAEKKGVSKQTAAIASSLEIVLQLYVMLLVSFIAIYFFGQRQSLIAINKEILYILSGLAIILFLLITPSTFKKYSNALLVKINRPQFERLNPRSFYLSLVFKLSGILLSGASVFFIIRMIHSISYSELPFIISASTLAFLLGLVAFFAPLGVGVRDAILMTLLSVVIPSPIALVATILIRLLAFLIELIFIGLAFGIDVR